MRRSKGGLWPRGTNNRFGACRQEGVGVVEDPLTVCDPGRPRGISCKDLPVVGLFSMPGRIHGEPEAGDATRDDLSGR